MTFSLPPLRPHVMTVDLGEHISSLLDVLVEKLRHALKAASVVKRRRATRSDVLREAVRALFYDLTGRSYLKEILRRSPDSFRPSPEGG